MINWKVRIKNKVFWLAIIPAVLTLIKAIAALFGFQIETEAVGTQLIQIVDGLAGGQGKDIVDVARHVALAPCLAAVVTDVTSHSQWFLKRRGEETLFARGA